MTHIGVSDFVPRDLDAADWSRIEPLARSLLERPVGTAADLEQWLVDTGDLMAAVQEVRADLYIATACSTEDKDAEAAYERFVEQIPPRLEPLAFELEKRYVELSQRHPLETSRFEVLDRSKKTAVRLFRPENIPIHTELDKLRQEHGRITGSMTVQFDGQERTLQQMARYLERPDRQVRESAWRTVSARRLQDRARLDDLLDRMVERRDRMARNADCANFIEYAFLAKERFDYTPEDCRKYWDACEKHVVPLMRRIDDRLRGRLGVETLRPWDLVAEPKGTEPLTPFDGGRELFDKTLAMMNRIDGRLGEMFARLGEGAPAGGNGVLKSEYLDLDSRKGKRPGGFQYQRQRTHRPFIFMNAAGMQSDIVTMVHEAGHAFHSMLCAERPLLEDRMYPMEFAEVASMSMEHLTRPYWGGDASFYPDEADHARAQRRHLEHVVATLAWIATIDAFQHWMYNNPGHTHEQRDAFWLSLDDRFGRAIDWSGLDDERASAWQKQPHLYGHALYYIEYGIAELGALQLWLRSRREGEAAAVDAYINALRLGGSRPLPELFKAAGLKFDFGADTVHRLMDEVEAELERIGD